MLLSASSTEREKVQTAFADAVKRYEVRACTAVLKPLIATPVD